MLQSQVHAAATAAPTIADPRIADPAFAPSASVRSARTGQGRRAAFWRVYMAAWMVLAGASVVYLAMFAASPEVQQRVEAAVSC